MKAKSGFTLVEILIVVVILGILAAIVVPQFTDASSQATANRVKADLQTVRSQIELYKIQHLDALPGSATGVDFETAMTSSTNQAGSTDGSDFGPYLHAIPTNPYADANSASSVAEGSGNPGTGSDGWYFNDATGAFNANTTVQSPVETAW